MPFLYISKNFNLEFMKKTALLLLIMVVILSCDKKQVYRNFENQIEAQRWSEKDVKIHTFDILEDGKSYNVFLEISHVLGSEMNEFPVVFEVSKPDGSTEKGEEVVNFKNADCMGDVCDVKILLKEKLQLKKGKYIVKFSPKSKFGFVPNIIGVGLSVEIKE